MQVKQDENSSHFLEVDVLTRRILGNPFAEGGKLDPKTKQTLDMISDVKLTDDQVQVVEKIVRK